MNIKRAIGFGIITWILILLFWSIVTFSPPLKDGRLDYILFWIALIPIVIISAKWYFRVDESSWQKGLALGVVGLVTVIVLDIIVTIPLFFPAPQLINPYLYFFSDFKLYIGFIWYIILTTYSGSEFDLTFTRGGEVKK